MSRLPSPEISDAPEAAHALFDRIKKGLGKVPNAYVAIGGLSPASLSVALAGDAALSGGALSRRELEAVRLSISSQNGCDYCVAAHSLAGKAAGLKPEALQQLRAGQVTGDSKLDALVKFVREVDGSTGTVPAQVVQQVLDAGYSPTQVTEALMAVALISFTNLFNRVNDTLVDFPIPGAA